jgi:hypothetical protein
MVCCDVGYNPSNLIRSSELVLALFSSNQYFKAFILCFELSPVSNDLVGN